MLIGGHDARLGLGDFFVLMMTLPDPLSWGAFMSKTVSMFIVVAALAVIPPLPVDCLENDPASDSAGDLDAAARELVRSQLRPDVMEEIYQQITPLMAVMIENSIQPTVERPLTDLERYQLTIFCGQRLRELITYSDMEDMLVPIVVKHLTLEDLDAINAFLATPAGRKLASTQAALMREGRAAGEVLGQKAGYSDRIEELSEALRRQFPQWFSVRQVKSEQSSATVGGQSVSAFWSTSRGDRQVTEGATVDAHSQVIRTSRAVYETTGETTCGDSICTGYHVALNETNRDGEDTESEMFFYQKITSDVSCTWGIGWAPEDRYSVGCSFLDIEGPIEAGRTWSFIDSLSTLERQFEIPPAVSYVGRIAETGVRAEVGGDVIEDCIEVVVTGSAEPSQKITCVDGQEAEVVMTTSSTRVFCPGMGSVLEHNTETNRKAADPAVVCTEYASDYRTISFEHGGAAPSNPGR